MKGCDQLVLDAVCLIISLRTHDMEFTKPNASSIIILYRKLIWQTQIISHNLNKRVIQNHINIYNYGITVHQIGRQIWSQQDTRNEQSASLKV